MPLSQLKAKHSLKQYAPTHEEAFIQNNGDHVIVDSFYTFLNFTYFNQSLYGLDGFDGFTPRTLYPSAAIGFEDKNATNILLIVDSAQEQ